MLFPVCCFSCGACIGHLWNDYIYYVNEYKKDMRTFLGKDNECKEKFYKRCSDEWIEKLGYPSPEELALITLNVNRMCCKRMFLTHVDTYNIMNLVK